MNDRKTRNTNTPGRMYDKISAQRNRATAKLDGAIARLRASHHGRFHAYVLNSINACSDPDELREMLARRAGKEQAQLPDPFWQIRGLINFIGSAGAGPKQSPPDSAPPSVPDAPEPVYTAEKMTPLDEKRIAVGRGR